MGDGMGWGEINEELILRFKAYLENYDKWDPFFLQKVETYEAIILWLSDLVFQYQEHFSVPNFYRTPCIVQIEQDLFVVIQKHLSFPCTINSHVHIGPR